MNLKSIAIIFMMVIFFSYCTNKKTLTVPSVSCTNPNHANAEKLYLSAFDKIIAHSYSDAIIDLKKSIELDSTCAEIFQQYRELIRSYGAIGDKENAIKYLNIAIPKTFNIEVKSEFLSTLASYKFNSEEYNECIRNCTEALRYNPENVEANYFRGLSKMALKDNHGAYQDINIVISQFESNYSTVDPNLDELGQRLQNLEKGKYSNIIGPAYFYRGILLYGFGEKDKGCADLRRAGEEGFTKAYKYISDYCN